MFIGLKSVNLEGESFLGINAITIWLISGFRVPIMKNFLIDCVISDSILFKNLDRILS